MAEVKNLGRVAAVSGAYELPDGSSVEWKALTLADWATIERAAAKDAKRNLIETYAENLEYIPEAIRETTMLDVFQRAVEIKPETLAAKAIFVWLTQSREGDLTALWLGMKRANPTVTRDQASELWALHKAHVKPAAKEIVDASLSILGNDEPLPAEATAGEKSA